METVLGRIEALVERLERLVPDQPGPPDWSAAAAFRWQKGPGGAQVAAVAHPHRIRLADLHGIESQKELLDRNTRQFLTGLPANNALLWGARGTGKSSLIKALLNEYRGDGLRLIEVDRHELTNLPTIMELIEDRPEKFIVFCDDLSFEADDASYKALKVVLDGTVSASIDNILVYATSNRRHLLPEYMEENRQAQYVGGEIHQGEAVEEKIALSDRFGLWISFYPFEQDTYLDIVKYWLNKFQTDDADDGEVRRQALQWALARGVRSGRAAWQFARDWAGRQGVD